MDINFYKKTHYKIMESYRHDIMMRKIKEREDKLFRKMFINVLIDENYSYDNNDEWHNL